MGQGPPPANTTGFSGRLSEDGNHMEASRGQVCLRGASSLEGEKTEEEKKGTLSTAGRGGVEPGQGHQGSPKGRGPRPADRGTGHAPCARKFALVLAFAVLPGTCACIPCTSYCLSMSTSRPLLWGPGAPRKGGHVHMALALVATKHPCWSFLPKLEDLGFTQDPVQCLAYSKHQFMA